MMRGTLVWLAVVLSAGVASAKPMSTKDLVKIYTDCWSMYNSGNFDKFAGCYAEAAKSHWLDSGMPDKSGPKDIVDNAKAFKTAMPDNTGHLQLVLGNGKNVFSVALMTGTHKGPLMSPQGEIKATGKKVGMMALHGVTFGDDNKVSEEWFVQDFGTLMSQLGLSPAPARPLIETAPAKLITALSTGNATEKANLALYKQEMEGFNKHDAVACTFDLADDFVEHDYANPADASGKQKNIDGLKSFLGAFPDMKMASTSLWAAGPYVVNVGIIDATNDGDFPAMNLKKTGKKIHLNFVEVTEYKGGKNVQVWRFYNGAAMAMQLGLVPPPGGAAPAAKTAPATKPAPTGKPTK